MSTWHEYIYVVEVKVDKGTYQEVSRHRFGAVALLLSWWKWWRTGVEYRVWKQKWEIR